MSDGAIELLCARCRRTFSVRLAEVNAGVVRCPSCRTEIGVQDDQLDEAVERALKSERRGLKPKLGRF